MKIQHYAIVFIIIILPFSIICRSRINNKIDVLNNETKINNALDVATMDAIDTLIDLNEEYYALYDGQTIEITPTIAKEGIKVFFQSLSLNDSLPFVANEKFAEEYFSPYIPAIVVVAYDGFYIYSVEKNSSSGLYEYVLSPKIPYAYVQSGYYINFSLGNYIKLCTPTGEVYEGEFTKGYINESIEEYMEMAEVLEGDKYAKLSEDNLEMLPQLTRDMSLIIYALNREAIDGTINNPSSTISNAIGFLNTYYDPDNSKNIPMFNDYDVTRPESEVSEFNKIRRNVIINLITDTLNEKMNNHNRYADMMGITYNFYLPEIENAQWINAVDDVSIMAFVQGIPTSHETYYNSYALRFFENN